MANKRNIISKLLDSFKSKVVDNPAQNNRASIVGAGYGKSSGFTSDYRTDLQLLLVASYDTIVSRCIKLIINSTLSGGFKIKAKDETQQKLLDNIVAKLDINLNSKFLIRASLGAGADCIAYLVEDEQLGFKLHTESTNWHAYRRLVYQVNPYTKKIHGDIQVVDSMKSPIATISRDKVILFNCDNLQNDYLGFTPLMEVYRRVVEKNILIDNNIALGKDGNRLFGVFSPKLDMIKGASPSEQSQLLMEIENAVRVLGNNADSNLKNYAYLSLPFDYTRTQATNIENAYLDTVRQINYEICSAFGVPPSLVQFDPANDPNLSNSAQYRDNFSELNTNDMKSKLEIFWTDIIKMLVPNIEFSFYISREETDESIALRDQFRENIKACLDLQKLGINAKPDIKGLEALGIVIDNQESQDLTLVDAMENSTKTVKNLSLKYTEGKFYDGFKLVKTLVGIQIDASNIYKITFNQVNNQNPDYIYVFNVSTLGETTEIVSQASSQNIDSIQSISKEEWKTTLKLNSLTKIKTLDSEILDGVFKKYHETVNLSYSELLKWSENPISKLASLDRSPIRRNLELLNIKKEEWTQKHITWASKTNAFIARMKNGRQGEDVKLNGTNTGWSKRDISLMNWAYNPKKGQTKAPKAISIDGMMDFDKLVITKDFKQFKSKIHDSLKSQLDKLFNNLAKETKKDKAVYSDSKFYEYILKNLPELDINSLTLVELMQSSLLPNILEQYNAFYETNYTIDNLPSTVTDTLTTIADTTITGNKLYAGINGTTSSIITGVVKQFLAKDNINIDDYASLNTEDKFKVVEYLKSEGKSIILKSRTDLISQIIANNSFNTVHKNLAETNIEGKTLYCGVVTRRDNKVRGEPENHIINDGHYYNLALRDSSKDLACRCLYEYSPDKDKLEVHGYLPLAGFI